MGLISVIIVTYNSKEYIESCIDSVFAQKDKDWEVIVIDNASCDGTREILKSKYPRIAMVENPENYGYSKALNQGIAKTRGEFILCLNDDVKLRDNDFLTAAYNTMNKDERIGAIQPKVLKPSGAIDTTGIGLSFLRRFYDFNSGKIDAPELNRQKYVFGACNAAAFYRRKALEEIKQGNEYFDEDFFCLVEDVDISWRLQKKSWLTLYQPNAVCIHNRGLSRRKDNFTQYLNMRNRYLMIIKNESLWGFLRFPFIFLIYDLWRNLFMLIINHKYLLKAYYEIRILLPKILNKRKTCNLSVR
ncbi:MAG: glycosyltransferase family 2 protein [Candidatus Omnitrophica bacterium]|nr:glycosyltransferase family 2 protein [Candidatus Omnitrophota bacterium]